MKKLKLRPKIELFRWSLYNDGLPSNDFLVRRKLSNLSGCPRGCMEDENEWHIAGNCSKLHEVIFLLNKWGFQNPIFNNLQDCFEGLKKLVGKNSIIAKMYCTSTWLVWKSRCKLIHDGIEDSNNFFASYVVSTSTFSNFFNQGPENWDTNQRELFCSWYPPPTGWIKLNVDASILSNNVAGFGGVIRDEKGIFLLAFGINIMHWDIAQIELMAILHLKYIFHDWMFEAQGIIIEGDNFNIINILQSAMKNWKVSKRIEEKFSFLLDFNQVMFSFSKICCNKLADICANLALKSLFTWENIGSQDIPPPFLFCLKEECDSLGLL
ncbi:uncharacterized protein LOC110114070 [Dendrobium catenatum]|uniref:uncharacterized protein LOC110114070 n=1 Tax=Dendrobium catenatum TaxID=906689 RepID=UPI0009F1DD6A|nr:uncharacterized protein LOC110114070 [Dendrobium catenatum]